MFEINNISVLIVNKCLNINKFRLYVHTFFKACLRAYKLSKSGVLFYLLKNKL